MWVTEFHRLSAPARNSARLSNHVCQERETLRSEGAIPTSMRLRNRGVDRKLLKYFLRRQWQGTLRLKPLFFFFFFFVFSSSSSSFSSPHCSTSFYAFIAKSHTPQVL